MALRNARPRCVMSRDCTDLGTRSESKTSVLLLSLPRLHFGAWTSRTMNVHRINLSATFEIPTAAQENDETLQHTMK